MIGLTVRDEGSDADDRVIDVLRKLVADRLAHFYVGLANKIVGGRKPAEVGYSLQVPDNDVWLHAEYPSASFCPFRFGTRGPVPMRNSMSAGT
jgi:hypothetical protein